MNKIDIIKSLQQHIKDNPKLIYYQDCLKKIKELPDKLRKIPNQSEYLESLRIHICYNMDKYKIFLYNKIKSGCSYVKYTVTQDVFDKLIYQLVGIKESNSIIGLADINTIPKFNLRIINNGNNKNKVVFFILIADKNKELSFKNKTFKLGNLYESMGYVFGVNIMKLLKYQRVDRIIDFIKKGGESYKIYELLDKYLKLLQSFDWRLRDKFMVHSGAFYQAIGTTYTNDIDLLILQENTDEREARELIKRIGESVITADPNILINNGNWVSKDPKIYTYKSNWFNYILPSMAGAKDIYDINTNPTHNFMFMGIKFISIDMNIKRFLSRSNSNAYVDLLMLEEYNGLKLGSKLCIPNMTIRQGKLIVFNDKTIDWIHKSVKEKLMGYYKKDMDIDTIKKKIKKCMVQGYEIYKGAIIKDQDTDIIKVFHLFIKDEMFKKYGKQIDYLLDVGTGKLTDLRFWNKIGIKHVYGIEPSADSVEKAYNTLEKIKPTTQVKIIHSVGNVNWATDKKFQEIIQHKYDLITYQYTFHYMLKSIDKMIQNMKLVMKKGTKIIISCMDGNKINREFQKAGKVEVRNYQEPIFAIVPMYDHKKVRDFNGQDILVYFKGAYGVANGSIEGIIDIEWLINKFSDNGLKLLERKNFIDYNFPIRDKMKYNQKQVSSYYMSLVFEYN